jgi:two-component system, chemotaxis family, chemotaxis protein CheY
MAASLGILVADAGRQMRATICEVLRSAGHRDLIQAETEEELRHLVSHHRPRIIVMAANFPGAPGLSFAKQIRGGLNFVPRETSIILTTDAPTRSFLEAARTVGVDEIVAIPFTTRTLMARIASVVERPRPFVDCPVYVGPCRRRVMLQDYKGPRRRAAEPAAPAADAGPLWSTESNRSAVRLCVQKMSEYRAQLAPEHFDKLRTVYVSIMRVETRSDQEHDDVLGEAAKSFGRYISTLSPGQSPDLGVLSEHIDAIHTLAHSAGISDPQRRALVAGLRAKAHVVPRG